MATRFYFTAQTQGSGPDADSTWDKRGDMVRRRLMTTTPDSAQESNAANNGYWDDHEAVGQFVSDPLPAQNIEGTYTALAAQSLSSGSGNTYIIVRLFSGDLATSRGTLDREQGDDLTTSLLSRQYANAETVTEVQATEGDRLVVELGIDRGPYSSQDAATIRYGAVTADTDFTTTGETVTGKRGWIEFSQDLFVTYQQLDGTASATGDGTGELDVPNDANEIELGPVTVPGSLQPGGDIDVYTPVPVDTVCAAVSFAGGDLVDLVFFGDTP